MHKTEQNKTNKPTSSSVNIGAVLTLKFSKQEITMQKSCSH